MEITEKSFIDINSTTILKKFNKILKNQKSKEIKKNKYLIKTHIVEYIFAKIDLEQWTYQDIYKLLSSTYENSNCIIDVMIYTKSYAAFIHIENGKHEIVEISPQSFFNEKTFQNFIEIVKKNQAKNQTKYHKLNSIFVFGGHCNGWKCYTDDYTVDFEMIYNTFIKNNMKWNAICFDCCYTSTLELLYQFHDITDYIIAHQSYVYGNGFNTKNLSKIFDNNDIENDKENSITFLEKLIILSMDYLVRTIDENEYSNFTIINTYFFKDFLKLFKENYKAIQDIIGNKKSKIFLSDVCNKCITDIDFDIFINSNSIEYQNENYSDYNNMLDLYSIIKLFDNKKMIELFKKSVFYKENDLQKDEKYFNKNMKLNGINIIIIPPTNFSKKKVLSKNKDKKLDLNYSNLRFYKDFLL
jgi:hypothetical protein